VGENNPESSVDSPLSYMALQDLWQFGDVADPHNGSCSFSISLKDARIIQILSIKIAPLFSWHFLKHLCYDNCSRPANERYC
jgi:predicted metal-binding membrane protein